MICLGQPLACWLNQEVDASGGLHWLVDLLLELSDIVLDGLPNPRPKFTDVGESAVQAAQRVLEGT